MENSNIDDDYIKLSYTLNKAEDDKTKSPQINRKASSPKKPYRKDRLKLRKQFSLNDEIEKTKEDIYTTSFNLRKSSMPQEFGKNSGLRNSVRLKESKKLEKKEVVNKPIKKDNINRKFMRKNAKKNIATKKKRGGGEIKVVGKVSAKLSSLIERLQQNTVSSENKVNKDFGDKVVMAPRIKAALEKFNKKKQEQPLFTHKGQPYKRKFKSIDDQSSQGEKEDGSTINYDDENDEEEEYEEDEDYEEGDEEEEEEEEKVKSRPRKTTKRRKQKKDLSNDDENENDSKSENKKKKRKRKKKKRHFG